MIRLKKKTNGNVLITDENNVVKGVLPPNTPVFQHPSKETVVILTEIDPKKGYHITLSSLDIANCDPVITATNNSELIESLSDNFFFRVVSTGNSGVLLPIIYNRIPLPDRITSYDDFDEGYHLDVGTFNEQGVIEGKRVELVDYYNLTDVNQIGRDNSIDLKKRFTGVTGGYKNEIDFLYYDINGVLTTEALAFPFNYSIDHYHGIGFVRGCITQSTVSYYDALELCNSFELNNWSDFFLPYKKMIKSILREGVPWTSEPRLINDDGLGTNFFTCTTARNPLQIHFQTNSESAYPNLKSRDDIARPIPFRVHYK